jgi:hypothetical protein
MFVIWIRGQVSFLWHVLWADLGSLDFILHFFYGILADYETYVLQNNKLPTFQLSRKPKTHGKVPEAEYVSFFSIISVQNILPFLKYLVNYI